MPRPPPARATQVRPAGSRARRPRGVRPTRTRARRRERRPQESRRKWSRERSREPAASVSMHRRDVGAAVPVRRAQRRREPRAPALRAGAPALPEGCGERGPRHPEPSTKQGDPRRPSDAREPCSPPDDEPPRAKPLRSPGSPEQASRRCGSTGAWAQAQPSGRRKAMRRGALSSCRGGRDENGHSGYDDPRRSGDEGNDRVNPTPGALGMPCAARVLPRAFREGSVRSPALTPVR